MVAGADPYLLRMDILHGEPATLHVDLGSAGNNALADLNALMGSFRDNYN